MAFIAFSLDSFSCCFEMALQTHTLPLDVSGLHNSCNMCNLSDSQTVLLFAELLLIIASSTSASALYIILILMVTVLCHVKQLLQFCYVETPTHHSVCFISSVSFLKALLQGTHLFLHGKVDIM